MRRSPAGIATPAAPRLACVKPVASVHPEPGSNSPLFYFVSVFSLSFRQPDKQPRIVPASALLFSFSLDGGLPPSSFVLSLYRIISMFSAPFPFRKAVTKVLPLFLTAKFFANFFFKFLFQNPASAPVRRPPASRSSFMTSGLFRFCGCKGTVFSVSHQTFFTLFLPDFSLFFTTRLLSTSYKRKKIAGHSSRKSPITFISGF